METNSLRSGGKKQKKGVKQQKEKKNRKRSEPSGGLGKCKGWWCLETYLWRRRSMIPDSAIMIWLVKCLNVDTLSLACVQTRQTPPPLGVRPVSDRIEVDHHALYFIRANSKTVYTFWNTLTVASVMTTWLVEISITGYGRNGRIKGIFPGSATLSSPQTTARLANAEPDPRLPG